MSLVPFGAVLRKGRERWPGPPVTPDEAFEFLRGRSYERVQKNTGTLYLGPNIPAETFEEVTGSKTVASTVQPFEGRGQPVTLVVTYEITLEIQGTRLQRACMAAYLREQPNRSVPEEFLVSRIASVYNAVEIHRSPFFEHYPLLSEVGVQGISLRQVIEMNLEQRLESTLSRLYGL